MGSGLPLAAVTGWAVTDISACVGLLKLLDGVLEGHTFSSFPLATREGGSATWSIWVVVARFGTLN